MPRPGLSEQPSNSSANPARAALVLLTYRNIGIDKRGAALTRGGGSAMRLERRIARTRRNFLGALAGDDQRAAVEEARLIPDRGREDVDL
jgi:hypothetical protein